MENEEIKEERVGVGEYRVRYVSHYKKEKQELLERDSE